MMEDMGTQVCGSENEQDTISEFELQQILLAIIPESEDIKAAFIRWVSLPPTLKEGIEKRLDDYEASAQGSILSVRDAYVSKIYSMGKILLQVFVEWDHIQDTMGAPGVVSGYCSLTKSLETDINNAVHYFQEQMEKLIGQYELERHSLASQSIMHRLRSKLGLGLMRSYANQGRNSYDIPGPESCRLTERLVSTRSSISDTVVSGSEALGLIDRHHSFFMDDTEKLRLDALMEGCQSTFQPKQCSSASSSEYGDSRSGTGATGSSSDDEPNVSAMSETGSEDYNEY